VELKRILLLLMVLIVYGSFYPWHFQSVSVAVNPLRIMLQHWPSSFDRYAYRDIVVNIALYVPFGVFCFLSLSEARSLVLRCAVTLLSAALLSGLVETVQIFIPGRVCSLFDVLCNVSGAAIGIPVAASFSASIQKAVRTTEALGIFRWSGSVALLYLWAGYLLFPFFPALSRTAVRLKLAALLSSEGWAFRDMLEAFGGWLAVSALLESIVGRRLAARLLPAALLLMPARLFIAHRTMTGSELIGALSGVACWMGLRTLRQPALAAGILAVAALIAGGLLPFHFSGAPGKSFTWIPFLPMLQTPWDSAFVILLRKCFLYGSAIWLLRVGGLKWAASLLTVVITLAAVEAAQIFLPGRTPESTDPLLALLLGFGVMLVERHAESNARERMQLTAAGISPGARSGASPE
jgi:VanZ family protein